MQLLNNVFITDTKFHEAVVHIPNKPAYNRYLLGNPDQLDIYKYSLASWSVLPLTRAIIYCKLDKNYEHRYDELERFIKEEFTCPVFFYKYRNEKQRDWQKTITELTSDEIIYYICNHDHIFLDSNLDTINNLISRFYSLYRRGIDNISSFVSHWPEILNVATNNNGKLNNGFIEFGWQTNSSVQIVTHNILDQWWNQKDYGDRELPRPDWFFFNIDEVQSHFILSRKELFRHFDGYSLSSLEPNKCPPLDIPQGFFDNNIKISYGEYMPGYTVVNPVAKEYKTINNNGADIINFIENIPLFWKPKISRIVQHNFDLEFAKQNVREFNIAKARARADFQHIPLDWIEY